MRADDLVRETLASYAERAPAAGRLAEAARRRAASRRRAGFTAGAAALATAATVVGVMVAGPRPEPGLEASQRLDGSRISTLATALNTLPEGLTDPPPRSVTKCENALPQPIVATFRYDGAPDVVLHINTHGCDELGATNGTRHVKFEPAFLRMLMTEPGFVGTPALWHGWLDERED